MRGPKLIPFILFLLFACDSYAQLKAGTIRVRREVAQDSIIYEEDPVVAKHADYMDSIAGNWEVVTMKRQTGRETDYMVNASLVLNKDSTFTGNTGCNTFSGKFSLKGSSIRFNQVTATEKACTFQEQESWYLRLLQNTISRFTVTNDELWLRDGSSNIVFEAKKADKK
ncbi:META domain-containing protein [Paraflavisolibacter sp. H34]|uniref:META domain-containing protein n=1 Tax=Huijunlia imazamoxiresistens TaxID=3127457 RepID=UPI0030198294